MGGFHEKGGLRKGIQPPPSCNNQMDPDTSSEGIHNSFRQIPLFLSTIFIIDHIYTHVYDLMYVSQVSNLKNQSTFPHKECFNIWPTRHKISLNLLHF